MFLCIYNRIETKISHRFGERLSNVDLFAADTLLPETAYTPKAYSKGISGLRVLLPLTDVPNVRAPQNIQ